jgi:predicted CXXCH cytochrome family protein
MRRTCAIAALCAALALAFAAPAMATDGDTIPHGGYSMTTDACLQCHDIHEAAGDYVLMREATVVAVCGTCHTLYQQAPTGAYDPGYSGAEAGTAAHLAAYKVPASAALTHEGHRLGLGAGTYTFADGVVGNGSYIPGGTDGLTAIKYLAYGDTVDALSFEATNGMTCASCHTPHGNYGNMVDASVSSKILSSKPNHIDTAIPLANWATDGGKWCGGCHDKRTSGGAYHNHPDYTCLDCHGDDLLAPTEDFPHTSSSPNILTLEPDALCIQCHVAGLLP